MYQLLSNARQGVTIFSISQKLGRLRLGPGGEVELPRRPERSLPQGDGERSR